MAGPLTRQMVEQIRREYGFSNSGAESQSVRYWMNVEGASISDLEQALEARREREGMGRMRPDPTGRGPGGSNYTPSVREEENDPYAIDPQLAMQTAKMALPWASEQLLSVYQQAFIEFGDTALALQEVRNGSGKTEYDRVFVGNRREDGTLRLSENEYLSTVQQFKNTLSMRGLNPSAFGQRYGELISGEVSAREFESRVSAISTEINQRGEDIRRAFAEESGISDMSNSGLLATALDPEGVGRELLERRIDIAQVRGTAAQYGIERSSERVNTLIEQAGVDIGAAQNFYGTARRRTRQLSGLARVYEGQGQQFGLSSLENALLLGNDQDRTRIEQLIGREQSAFSRSRGVVQQEGNALTGLATRRGLR